MTLLVTTIAKLRGRVEHVLLAQREAVERGFLVLEDAADGLERNQMFLAQGIPPKMTKERTKD